MGTTTAQTTREALFAAIRGGWTAGTSSDPAWSRRNPALGQCAVTALVVQTYLGGELMRAMVGSVSHYWNRLPGEDVDLTREQFTRFTPSDIGTRHRQDLMTNGETRRRYSLLLARVAGELGLSG